MVKKAPRASGARAGLRLLLLSLAAAWPLAASAYRPFNSTDAAVAPKGERQPARRRKVWMAGSWRELAVWNRAQIGTETRLAGPAVIEEPYTTVLIGDGWTCRRHASGHLIAERKAP